MKLRLNLNWEDNLADAIMTAAFIAAMATSVALIFGLMVVIALGVGGLINLVGTTHMDEFTGMLLVGSIVILSVGIFQKVISRHVKIKEEQKEIWYKLGRTE